MNWRIKSKETRNKETFGGSTPSIVTTSGNTRKNNNNGKLSLLSFLHHIFRGKFMTCDTTFYFTQNTQIQINAKQGINYWETEENFFCWSNRFVFFPPSASKLIFGQWVPTQKIKFTSINNKKISLSTFVAQQSVVLLILDIDLRPSLLTTFLRTFSAWKPLLAGQHSLLNSQPKQWTDLLPLRLLQTGKQISLVSQ